MSTLKIRENSSSPWQSIPTGGVGVPAGGTTNQFLTKSSNVDYATQWSTVTPATIGAMAEWDLLWENASPTSSFAGQTILASGLSAYDMVAIQIIYSDSYTHTTIAFSPINGGSLDISVVSSDNQRIACGYRIATVATTGIIFSDGSFIGSSSNRTTNNSYGIPQRVWGLKGVNNS